MMYSSDTIAGQYAKCESDRYSYLERARDSSRLTIPTIMPDSGSTKSRKFPTPFQSKLCFADVASAA